MKSEIIKRELTGGNTTNETRIIIFRYCGFDLAAEWMGWDNIFHCEWNEFGQKILKYYWPNAISYGDITKTDFTKHRGTSGVKIHVDLYALSRMGLLPTPKARDVKGQSQRGQHQKGDALCNQLDLTGSQLNPRFVAEMMGFPVNWTELPFLSGEMKVSKDLEMQ